MDRHAVVHWKRNLTTESDIRGIVTLEVFGSLLLFGVLNGTKVERTRQQKRAITAMVVSQRIV